MLHWARGEADRGDEAPRFQEATRGVGREPQLGPDVLPRVPVSTQDGAQLTRSVLLQNGLQGLCWDERHMVSPPVLKCSLKHSTSD